MISPGTIVMVVETETVVPMKRDLIIGTGTVCLGYKFDSHGNGDCLLLDNSEDCEVP